MNVIGEYDVIRKLKEGYSLSRFGDGEVKMMLRSASIYKLQTYDEKLQEILLKVFEQPLENLLIGIPNPLCTRPWVSDFISNFEGFVKNTGAYEKSIFVSAFFSRPSLVNLDSKRYFKRIKELWMRREIVLINFNPDIRRHPLFRESILNYIKILRRNCFADYDRILDTCQRHYGKGKIFLVSAGPAASCLAYDIASAGEQCIDIGQIVLEYSIFKGERNNERWTSQNSYVIKRGYLRGINDCDGLTDVEVNIARTKGKLKKRREKGVVIDQGNAFRLMNAFVYFVDYTNKNFPLLDIGTREGWFLEYLVKAGYKDVQAIEVCPEAVAIVKAKGLRATEMDAQKMQFRDMFGTITAVHVLEHCSDPQKVVNNIYGALKKGGVLYLEIPLELTPFPRASGHFSSFPEAEDLFTLFDDKWSRLVQEVVPANRSGTKRTLRSVWKKIK